VLLKSSDADLQRAGGKLIAEIPGGQATRVFAESLASLSSGGRVVLLGALEERGDKAAAPYVRKAVGGPDETVRLAAVGALGVLGDVSCVELLTKTAAEGGRVGGAALRALGRISDKRVSNALGAIIKGGGEPPIRVAAIRAAVDRGDPAVLPVLFKAAGDASADVRAAAHAGLGDLAGAGELPVIISMLISAESSADRASIERALIAAVNRIGQTDAQPVIAGMSRADDAAKAPLLGVLARIGGEKALDAVRSAVKSGSSYVKRAAIRAMADWKDASPLSELLAIAKAEPDSANHILALRGYIKLVGVRSNRSRADSVKLLADAMAAARRAEEKKAVLAALPSYPCKEALDLAESAGDDSEIAVEAGLAVERIKGRMSGRRSRR